MPKKSKEHNRLPGETISIVIGKTETSNGHDLSVSLAYDPKTEHLREVVFVGRGKIGQGMDEMLRELGIKLSRVIQGRDPESSEAM